MKSYWNSDDDTRLTRWLYSIIAILFIGPAARSGITESFHRTPFGPSTTGALNKLNNNPPHKHD